jgi:hypothetical protein
MKKIFTILGILIIGMPVFAQTQYLPNLITLQHAGGIGSTVLGLGYQTKSGNFDASLLYGYVPPKNGGRLDIITLKATYSPININLTPNVAWKPVNPTAFFSYTTNKYFYTRWPSRYFDDYYWWSSAFRVNMGVQSSLNLKLPAKYNSDSFTLYAEWSTNDLYLESYLTNRESLSLWDISVMAVGLKVHFNH